MTTEPQFQPLTRARAAYLLDRIRMAAAEIDAAKMRTSSLVAEVDTCSSELYRGICKEMPPDIEIQPRIVRSA